MVDHIIYCLAFYRETINKIFKGTHMKKKVIQSVSLTPATIARLHRDAGELSAEKGKRVSLSSIIDKLVTSYLDKKDKKKGKK